MNEIRFCRRANKKDNRFRNTEKNGGKLFRMRQDNISKWFILKRKGHFLSRIFRMVLGQLTTTENRLNVYSCKKIFEKMCITYFSNGYYFFFVLIGQEKIEIHHHSNSRL